MNGVIGIARFLAAIEGFAVIRRQRESFSQPPWQVRVGSTLSGENNDGKFMPARAPKMFYCCGYVTGSSCSQTGFGGNGTCRSEKAGSPCKKSGTRALRGIEGASQRDSTFKHNIARSRDADCARGLRAMSLSLE
jgi:hypothetical protein